MRPLISRFRKDQRGAVLVETLIAAPVMIVLSFGIVEFGTIMWQRQQLQVGVRDAARYWSRCNPTFSLNACSVASAQHIALYGHPNAPGVSDVPRVPGWDTSGITISPALPPTAPNSSHIVVVEGTVTYQGSPLFNAVFRDGIELGYYYTTRYQQW